MENRYTVLIVDDAEHNIELMSEMLKDSYNIITADSGTRALEIMRGEDPPDVVLLDMLMPKPDGYDVLQTMNEDEALRAIPVVVVTADSDPNAQSRSYALGAVDFVSRGADMNLLRYRVKSVLRLCELDKIRRENESLRTEISLKRQLSALVDNLPGGVAIIRTDGETAKCTYYNSELPALFRMSSDQFVMQFAMPVYPDWLTQFIRKAKTTSESFTITFSIGDESDLELRQWIRLTAGGMGENNGMTEMYCVFLDINAEKRQELRAEKSGIQLRENQDRLETVVNNAPGGITLSERREDGHFHTVFINRGLADILGYSDYEQCLAEIAENPSTGVSEQDALAIRQMIAEVPKTGGHFGYAFGCVSHTNAALWLSMNCQLMYGEDGRVKMYSFITDTTKEKQFEDELRSAAFFDPLTGLYNRHAFMRNARRAIDENPLTQFSLMRLNIGSFKVVNDLLGRDVGDKVLNIIAQSIRELFTGRGVFARFFADNFLILTPYSERGVHPQTVLDTIQKAVMSSGLITHDVQYYIGVYTITDRDISVENMTDRAAMACRSINGSFQEHIAYYDEKMRLSLLEEQRICDESRRALQNGEFCVYYQPVYGINAKRFVSAEALVRWNHPTRGMISPGKFVPVFEKNGFIAELDLYVLEQVCKYMKRRREEGLPKFPVSVNISRTSLYDPNLFDTISAITDSYGVDPSFLRIEITESAYNDNPVQLLETIGKFREKGHPVLMDDFGSGYSSLNTLKDIPIDILKLDMKFMQGFEKNAKVGTIVTSVARMSAWLNIPMLAEGVETKEQFDFLTSVGCAYIQGFYFSRPVPVEEFTKLIAQTEVSGDISVKENYILSEDVNELLGSNAIVSKLISGAFGGFGIYEMYDNKLEAIRVNDGYMKIMGYSPEDFNKEHVNIWDLMPPESAEASRRACLEALKTDKAVHTTVRRRNKNGEYLTLDGVHRKLGGSDENPIICIAFNDITELLASERRVDRSKTEIDEILGATGAIVTDVDFENGTIFRAGNMSDYDVELDKISSYTENISPFARAVHPEDIEKARRFHADRWSGKTTEEFRIFNRTDGKYYWWKFTDVCTFDDNGKIVRLIGIANNIDAEKRAKLDLEQERAHMDAVMRKLGAGILMVDVSKDHSAHILFSNDSFWKTIGQEKMSDEDFFGSIYNGLSDDDKLEINNAVLNGGSMKSRYHITRGNGENAVLELTVGLFRADDDNRVYMILVSDITKTYNDRIRLEAIVRNFRAGLALVDKTESGVEITYANDRFFSIFDAGSENSKLVNKMLNRFITAGTKTGDIRITHGNSTRIVRISTDETGRPRTGVTNYVVSVNDVTQARAESKNRIAERMANAGAGLYDEVVEINYRDHTVKLTSSRREPKRAENAKSHSLNSIVSGWGKKHIAAEDHRAFEKFILSPDGDPDFTDCYIECRVLDNDGEYHTLGMTLVRSRGDVCVMFIRDRARIDNSLTSAQVAETYRLYKLLAEQTQTTVIELDHVEKRVSCSSSIKDYWAAKLSDDDLANYEYMSRGPVVYPDDMKLYKAFLTDLYAGDKPQTVTVRMKMADESYKWCRVTVSLSRGKDGRVLTSLCTINLVNDEVETRNKLLHYDEFLRRTVMQIPVGVGVYRLENGIPVALYVSNNLHKIFDDLQGGAEAYFSLVEDFARNSGIVPAAGVEGSRLSKLKRSDGSDFWLSTKYRIMDENGELTVYAALVDDTDRVESHQLAAERELMYGLLLDDSGVISFDYDPQTDVFSYLIYSGDNKLVSLAKISEDTSKLTLLYEFDREEFFAAIKRLSKAEGTENTTVRVMADGYPRRYKALFKSVADENGTIFKIVGKLEDAEDELARMDRIQAKAMYDSLCVDIFNKPTTEELIRAELEHSTAGVLMMIDVDNFKNINDSFGHVFGDEFLKKFASTIKSSFRESDIVGRYGGDEFFVFLPKATASLAEKKARQILESTAAIEVPIEGGINASIGISAVTPENRDYTRLLKQADSALYTAKNLGKKQAVMFDGTMSEDSFRVNDAKDEQSVVLSSNPSGAASTMMRVFSALYSSANISEGINSMLALVGKTYDVSRVYIFEDTEDGEYCSNTFEWCAEGVTPEKDSLQSVSYGEDLGGNYRENMGDDGIFYCHDINKLSDKQRDILKRQGIRSVLQCAIINDGRYRGFVGFDECRNNRFWTQDQIDSLVFISKILSIFLMIERTKKPMPPLGELNRSL